VVFPEPSIPSRVMNIVASIIQSYELRISFVWFQVSGVPPQADQVSENRGFRDQRIEEREFVLCF
jgi:hypothetical protein